MIAPTSVASCRVCWLRSANDHLPDTLRSNSATVSLPTALDPIKWMAYSVSEVVLDARPVANCRQTAPLARNPWSWKVKYVTWCQEGAVSGSDDWTCLAFLFRYVFTLLTEALLCKRFQCTDLHAQLRLVAGENETIWTSSDWVQKIPSCNKDLHSLQVLLQIVCRWNFKLIQNWFKYWCVVWNIFYFSIYWE